MKTKIKKYPKYGRGVQAAKNFKKGELVEISPVIVVPKAEHYKALAKTVLNLYVFGWNYKRAAVALGHGSLFNHSSEPNITYDADYKREEMRFYAKRSIKKGEQLFINYGYTIPHAKKIYERDRWKNIHF